MYTETHARARTHTHTYTLRVHTPFSAGRRKEIHLWHKFTSRFKTVQMSQTVRNRSRDRQADRDRHTDRQTEIDRQRQTERHTERERERNVKDNLRLRQLSGQSNPTTSETQSKPTWLTQHAPPCARCTRMRDSQARAREMSSAFRLRFLFFGASRFVFWEFWWNMCRNCVDFYPMILRLVCWAGLTGRVENSTTLMLVAFTLTTRQLPGTGDRIWRTNIEAQAESTAGVMVHFAVSTVNR